MPSVVEIGPSVPEKNIFEEVLPHMGMRSSRSCDRNHLCTHWFPLPIDTSYQIWH